MTDSDLAAVIAEGRQIEPAPDVVRARLLARARATVTATAAQPLAPSIALATTPRWRMAVAAAVLVAFSAAGAGAALYVRVSHAPVIVPLVSPPPPSPRTPALPALHAPTAEMPPAAAAPEPISPPRSRHARRPLSPHESYAAELRLLQGAQSEYTSQDFPDALVLLAEHARRFPNGRLAEEREALRVRSLDGAGRGDEARRALASFASRFLHRALLPRLQKQVRATVE